MSITKRKQFIIRLCLAAVCFWLIAGCEVMKIEAGLQDNAYVALSPDGNAFTTNADETDTEWYEHGYSVYTGKVSTLREPDTGEHLYTVIRTGNVPVGKWTVAHSTGRCIHDSYPQENYFHGVDYGTAKCLKPYYSGWIAYCADCGQNIVNTYFYMSKQAALSLDELDMSMAYYYRCPWCTNLEMGVELKQHCCQEISANQYSVRYYANYGSGYMPKSIHMYNNATLYEGNTVTPQKNLTLNSYTREGYEFIGWNTEKDGTGLSFRDGQEIYNLCDEEQESIILYAQWRKNQSVLCIDPAGGEYEGCGKTVEIPGLYGSHYELNANKVEPPIGATVSFEVDGGKEVAPINVRQVFCEWSFRQPIQGSIEDTIYTYNGADGAVDYVKAVYQQAEILLPETMKEGYSFGGWYYDEEGTKVAGAAGDKFVAAKDVTLYAQWVELQLSAEDNYNAYGGIGAVDLTWKQPNGMEKTYLVYQKQEGGQWEKIHAADEIASEKHLSKNCIYTGEQGSYIIPYSGYYNLTLQGAQGQNCGGFSGGKGGQISAEIYFKKGEKLNYEIGGQNGYHGGGEATAYGNGGGYSMVSTEDRGILLIAGGGGGATEYRNGLPGGSEQGVINESNGQNGMAGGGGGYRGGGAGTVVIHEHDDACQHVHVGSPEVYGGCYTVLNVCNNNTFKSEVYRQTFYYGNIDDNGKHIFCVRCGSHECPGHRDNYYQYICTLCGTSYYNKKPNSCTALKRYDLGCDRTEEYVCSYNNGQLLQNTSAYGGSNFANAEECLTYQQKSGVVSGNGSLLIEAVSVGFWEKNSLNAVLARDCAAPDKIHEESVMIKPVDEGKVHVVFAKPKDYGTTYYHMAESYSRENGELTGISNETVNTLISGISGYRYCVDENADTKVDEQDVFITCRDETPYIGVSVTDVKKYLHIAAEDKAGNRSETIHIPVSSQEVIFWPVVTDQMAIRQDANVYKLQEDKTFFVRADGVTPFTVSFAGRLIGTAQSNYQVNQMHFLVQNVSEGAERGTLKLIVPMEDSVYAGSYRYSETEVQKQYAGKFVPETAFYTEVRRSDYCKKLTAEQAFTLGMELNGQKLHFIPQAAVHISEVQIFSDIQQDMENGIFLIADGVGPVITGLEFPEQEETAEIEEVELKIEAVDTGSGLKELRVEIRNESNGGYKEFIDEDRDGKIELSLSFEDALYWGRFTIAVYAEDNVGNKTVESYGMDSLSVTAYVENVMLPQSNVFKKGESGILHVQATGYAESVEIVFPEEWNAQNPFLNKIYVYQLPEAVQVEKIDFMIPLNVPEGEYSVIVRAYKEGKMAEAMPELLTIKVSGSVLDEIRTRLR